MFAEPNDEIKHTSALISKAIAGEKLINSLAFDWIRFDWIGLVVINFQFE